MRIIRIENSDKMRIFAKIKFKGIKKIRNILFNIVAVIVLIIASISLLLHNNKIQNILSDSLESYVSNVLQTKVEIGHIDYRFFNSIRLKNVIVNDQSNDTLLNIEKAYLRIRVRDLFDNKIYFQAIELDALHANLKQYSKDSTNLSFIIDAFKKPSKDKPSALSYRVDNLKIKNSTFSYRASHLANQVKGHSFDPSDILVRNLKLHIELNTLNKDSISIEVKKLGFTEKSGFIVKNLGFRLNATKKMAFLRDLELILPKSTIITSDVKLNFDSTLNAANFAEKFRFSIPIRPSTVYLNEFSALVPQLARMDKPVLVSADVLGSISSLRFKNLKINQENTINLLTDFEISGLPDIDQAFIYTDIKDVSVNAAGLQDFISSLSQKPSILPKELINLGTLRFRGNLTGFMSNIVAFGMLRTNIGVIKSDVLLKLENGLKDVEFSGKISTKNLRLDKLFKTKDLGELTMDIQTSGKKQNKKELRGNIDGTIQTLEFKSYKYNEIILKGKFSEKAFDGKALLNDPNIAADFMGRVDLTNKIPEFNFKLDVADANFEALHLIKGNKGLLVSFSGVTNITGNNPDNINGTLSIRNIELLKNNKQLNISQVFASSRISNNFTNFTVSSDLFSTSLSGSFTYSQVPAILRNALLRYLPSLLNAEPKVQAHKNSYIDIEARIENTTELSELLELPIEFKNKTQLKANIGALQEKFELNCTAPYFRFRNLIFNDIAINIRKNSNALQINSKANFQQKKQSKLFLNFDSRILNDTIHSNILWHSNDTVMQVFGELITRTNLIPVNNKFESNFQISPSSFVYNNVRFDVAKSQINRMADGTIHFQDFNIRGKDQFLQVDGTLANNNNNNLKATMQKLDLGFVFNNILRLKSIQVDGLASGKVSITSQDNYPLIIADLQVDSAKLNQKPIGNAHIKSAWNNDLKRIDIDADFSLENKVHAKASGVYVPSNDSLNILFDFNGFGIDFLHTYFEGVVDNLRGNAYGKIRMLGPTKILGFEGNALVKDALMRVKVLNTTYNFTDTVRLTRKSIAFNNIQFFDSERNRGTINGLVTHNGSFTNMMYNVDISARNIMGLNTTKKNNDYFYGKAYTTGEVNINGNDDESNIVVNVTTEPKTKVFIQMGGTSTAADNSFITFVSKADAETNVKPKTATTSRFNTKVDLNIDVNQNADMQLLIDPKAGDVIAGRGSGSLRVNFDTFSDIKLYGNYTIDNGYYLFTLQNIIRKEFKIDRGSTISFAGDPFEGKMNVRAVYPMTGVSLANILDQSELSSSTRRSTIPVDCILLLTDKIMSPTIKFEIDLPTADESLKQKVKSVINTEEMLNRQVAFLITANSFINPEVSSSTNNSYQSALNSFISSTLSSQLNNFIQKTIQSDIFAFGLEVQRSDQTDTQYKAQIMVQPNDRIVVNSNVGYNNGAFIQSPEDRYIFDVDFEYKLTDDGKIRFLAYHHTIDRAQLRDAKTTQGAGIAYRDEFESFDEMIKFYWNALTRNLHSSTKENAKQ